MAIERHTEPVEGRYSFVLRIGCGRALESAVVPNLVIHIEDVLGL
jgi:hypothetical protein